MSTSTSVLTRSLQLLVSATMVVLATTSPASAQLRGVATTEDLASIAREVGGDKIKVSTIAKGNQDPHYV